MNNIIFSSDNELMEYLKNNFHDPPICTPLPENALNPPLVAPEDDDP